MRTFAVASLLIVVGACSSSSSDAPSSSDAGGSDAGTADAPAGDPFVRERSTEDLPDDAPGAWQIHPLYVEPSDRTADKPLDTDGTLRRSITAWEKWYALRTGGKKLHFDTHDGVIDVTYVKLPAAMTEIEMATGLHSFPSGPVYVRERLENEVTKTFKDPKKLYLVYYDGLAFNRCGGAAYPPQLPGHVTAMYVGGIFNASYLTAAAAAGATEVQFASDALIPPAPFAATIGTEKVNVTAIASDKITLGAPLASAHAQAELLRTTSPQPDCRPNPFSSDGSELNYWEYAAAHECLHPMGIVPAGAPDFAQPPVAYGHLAETSPAGTRDLMYQGSTPWGCPTRPPAANADASVCELDPSHKNYWDVLMKSVFLDPAAPDAVPPADW